MHRHRFLAAGHVHALHFAPSSLRACQARLQRLWAGRFVDRLFLPAERPDQADRWARRPVYSLAARGAAVVAGDQALELSAIPHTPAQNRRGFVRLRHNLAATDVLVAIEAFAARNRPWSATVVREDRMASDLVAARDAKCFSGSALLPDGAVTVMHPRLPVPQTYLIEIVRAGVKAGNATVRRRLHQYRQTLRAGFFRDVFGFAWVRSVLFLTPTTQRAQNLAALARDIAGGDRLFRFGAYEHRVGGGTPTAVWRVDTVTDPLLISPSGIAAPLLPRLSKT